MRFFALPTALLALAGCSTPLHATLDAPMSEALGQAVASMDAQIIPAPVSSLAPDDSGARAAAAIARYQKGEVYSPLTPATAESVGNGVGRGMGPAMGSGQGSR